MKSNFHSQKNIENSDIKSLSISIASPEEILSWSYGEVTKPETLNYRTQRPEKEGLFSERIFGPTKDYECYCGKYKKIRYKDIICEKCGVQVTRSIVRRERMGHVTLAAPVAHIWFLKIVPSKLSLLLDVSVPKLEKVVYYAAYMVTSIKEEAREKALTAVQKEIGGKNITSDIKAIKEDIHELISSLRPGSILNESEYFLLSKNYRSIFTAERGGGAIRKVLEEIDLKALSKQLTKELIGVKDANRERRYLRRLKLIKSFLKANIRPEWMVMTVLPVLPPELRPMVALEGGRFATADLNDLYRRVINRNNRLRKLIELNSPDVIITNEKRMLQEAVDALIDNSARLGIQLMSSKRRPLRSLADMLKGKQGRFRQNLLGKRVDYSGRSVIVIGPELKLNECGLPKNLALEIFRPFVINKIIERGFAYNIKQANRFIEQGNPEVWAILEEVIANRMVLLNRAPTLHRLGIQAFKIILIEDLAIRIPALVCTAFNADFDGDQMAVHLPLTVEAQHEVQSLMNAGKNLLKPANGDSITNPTQDVVLGCYHLTRIKPKTKGEGKVFSSFSEATFAYENGHIDFNAQIKVHNGKQLLETSYGRLIFNNILPPDFGFVNETLNKKKLSRLVDSLIAKYTTVNAQHYIDQIKDLGFVYSTFSSTTWSMEDTLVPKEKAEIIAQAEKDAEEVENHYNEGLLTAEERSQRIISIWTKVKDDVVKIIPTILNIHNPIYAIIDSGARGSWAQSSQMMGMKGMVVNSRGETIELPIKSSYKEGLGVLEYFISTYGARKGTIDTALRTAQAGYLTRRLVDVAQDVIIREKDCKTKEGIEIMRKDGEGYGYKFGDRIYSRVCLEDVKVGNKILARAGEIITKEIAERIQNSDIRSIKIRSPIACRTLYSICSKCYGLDLSTNELIKEGEAVGIIAAQSIGEPGTQLTLRTFHVGGVAGVDITYGLPRIEELFESRPPKGKAVVVKADGKIVSIEEGKTYRIVKILDTTQKKKKKEATEYLVPFGVRMYVKEGDEVQQGDPLCEGPLDLKELLTYKGKEVVERYIINEVQKIYIPESASINDKHIEIIVRQMFSRVMIKDSGDTDLMVNDIIEKSKVIEVNKETQKLGKEPAKFQEKVLGITPVALTTESFLSAASFQQTARVLVNAACEGKTDLLRGLKENVIIGKLIPAGTGLNPVPSEELEKLKSILFPRKEEAVGEVEREEFVGTV